VARPALKVQYWIDRIDALELRERVLLLAATVAILFLSVDSAGFQPTLKAQQVAEERISEMEMKLGALRQQAMLLSYKTDEDVLAARYSSRDTLAEELAALDARIVDQLGALVEPAQAAELLEQVLTRHRGLKITSLRASAEPLDQLAGNTEQAGKLGRYQLDLVLEGGYLDLMRYLEALESMPWKFFWQTVDFRVNEYPRAVSRLQLYTLGAQDG
jgi:MSHA biogenesis protein MshJ